MKRGPKPRSVEMLTRAQLCKRLRILERLEGLESLYHVKLPARPLLKAVRDRGITIAREDATWRRALEKAAVAGEVSAVVADELCVRLLGLHPFEVYGDAWWMADA